MPDSTFEYMPVKHDGGSTYNLLEQASDTSLPPRTLWERRTWYRIAPWLAHVLLLCFFATLFLLSLRSNEVECGKKLSIFSPALEAVEYHDVRFNGTQTYPSEFRGAPNPALDAEWNKISTDMKPVRVTRDMLSKIGKPERPSLVKFHDEDGGGYMATLEFGHQLHCLNMLRKRTYLEYYESFDVSILAGPEDYRNHLDHCIEMLRQFIICNADVGVITYDWVEGHKRPYPDFNTWHKCRKVDKLMEWNHENELSVPFDRVTRFGEEADLTTPP